MQKSLLKTYEEAKGWFTGKDLSIVAFDTETEGLRYAAPIVGVSVCNGTDACYINLWNNPEFDKLIDLILKIISETKLLIGHNISYDIRVLKYYGLQV